jgi:uncharacterized protein (DUF302 family)
MRGIPGCWEVYMSYYFSTAVVEPFDRAVESVTEELKKEGFGILTRIDVKATLEQKLGVEFPEYCILGACNPPFAHKALLAEPRIGLMLPCNVIVRRLDGGRVEVAAIDPKASMAAVENEELSGIADEVRAKLRRVVGNL